MTVKDAIIRLQIIKIDEEEKLRKESKFDYEVLIKRNGKPVKNIAANNHTFFIRS